MPECQLPLSQAVVYIATAPKSNASAMAVWEAAKDVREGRTIPVPRHLRDAHYGGACEVGSGGQAREGMLLALHLLLRVEPLQEAVGGEYFRGVPRVRPGHRDRRER